METTDLPKGIEESTEESIEPQSSSQEDSQTEPKTEPQTGSETEAQPEANADANSNANADAKGDTASTDSTKEVIVKEAKEVIVKETSWYVLRVISGKERKLKEYIELEIRRSEWDKTILQVLVPTEKVYKIKNGKKVIQEKNFFPGYIMIEADGKMRGEMIQTIRNMTGVINFLGRDNPEALRKSEVNRILGKVDEMQDEGTTMNEPFIVGETVKIIDGAFNDFLGTIEEIYEEKKRLKVNVKIFGRKTPVELNFMQVEKQN